MLICPGCGEENPPKFRLCGYCGAALAAAAPAPAPLPVRVMRKTVTIVFSDLKDSTALGERIDTEALHEVKERYFSTMAAEIVRHGGKVEKYIGDAIMAVFGLPKAHEDDALRAVRAAHGMRVALDKLNEGLRQRYGVALANRTGVESRDGEELLFKGGSAVWGWDGRPLAQAGLSEEAVLVARIDPAETRDKSFNPRNDVLRDRRPEHYGRLTETRSEHC
jgi:hypothetical protein